MPTEGNVTPESELNDGCNEYHTKDDDDEILWRTSASNEYIDREDLVGSNNSRHREKKYLYSDEEEDTQSGDVKAKQNKVTDFTKLLENVALCIDYV